MTLYFNSKSFINYCNYKNDEVDTLIRRTPPAPTTRRSDWR